MSFDSFKLDDSIKKAVSEQGYTVASPIQQKAIPLVLEGHDLLAAAQTGTGKTAGFTLPILQLLGQGTPAAHNQARALIVTPTRELAAQIQDNIERYSKYVQIKSTVVFGGVKINPQMQKLRGGTDILVATPGRLLDLHNQNAIRFNQLEVLVLDEADRMLDMGFIHDIKRIAKLLPKKRQTLMFSATFSQDIRSLAKQFLHQPKEVAVAPENTTADKISQVIHPVDKANKSAVLRQLILDNAWDQVLVFVRTKHGANRLTKQLVAAKIQAAAIHGNKSQGARTKALAQFKSNQLQVLVATDIAARGIDIAELPHVVNYDLPQVAQDYVHRIGRTGRAGLSGEAVSLVSADEAKLLKDIEQLIGKTLPRVEIEGFEPDHNVPATSAVKKKRPVYQGKKKKRSNRSARNKSNEGREKRGNDNAQANTNNRNAKSKKKVAARRNRRPGAKAVNN